MAVDSAWKTYRHSVTGLIGKYDPRVALAHPQLIEVPDDAKPLAYTPINPEAVAQVTAQDEANADSKPEE